MPPDPVGWGARRTLVRGVLSSLALAVVVTGLTMLVAYQYCMDGPGRGLPMAVIHPSHSDEAASRLTTGLLGNDVPWGPMVDPVAFVVDVGAWALAVASARSMASRWRRRERQGSRSR